MLQSYIEIAGGLFLMAGALALTQHVTKRFMEGEEVELLADAKEMLQVERLFIVLVPLAITLTVALIYPGQSLLELSGIVGLITVSNAAIWYKLGVRAYVMKQKAIQKLMQEDSVKN